MDQSLYVKDGIVGMPSMDAKYGTQFELTGRFPFLKNRIFLQKSEAETFIGQTAAGASALPGLLLTVISDSTTNNGVYIVESCDVDDNHPAGLRLKKVGSDVQVNVEAVTFETDEEAKEATGNPDATAGTYIRTGSGTAEDPYKYSKIDIDLSEYAKKSDIPSLDGYATEEWVEDKGYLTSADNNKYRIVENEGASGGYKLQTSLNDGDWTDVEGSEITFADKVVSKGSVVLGTWSEDGKTFVESEDGPDEALKLEIANDLDHPVYIKIEALAHLAHNTVATQDASSTNGYVKVEAADQADGSKQYTVSAQKAAIEPANWETAGSSAQLTAGLIDNAVLEDWLNYRLGWEVIGN